MTTTEYETCLDYAEIPLNGHPSLDNLLFTSSIFNASDYDFSNMLKMSPPFSESQINVLDTHVNPQLARAKMPGKYVDGSEYFPIFPASTSQISWMPTSTIAQAALPEATVNDLPAVEVPQCVPLLGHMKPQSDTLAAKQDIDMQQCEAESVHIAGHKRARQATCPFSASQQPEPKRRRGARRKVRTEEELAIRRKKHLQRNKDAAQKCRQKKRVLQDETKENMVIERQKNLVIWNQVASTQDELEPLWNLALGIDHVCDSDDHKTAAKSCLEMVMKIAAKLQDQIDKCNQRRAHISQGLVMQRSFGGYAQQDSIQDGPGSEHDSQISATSPQNSNHPLKQMLSPRSGSGTSYVTRRLNTESASGNRITRRRSDSSTQPDSAVGFDPPPPPTC